MFIWGIKDFGLVLKLVIKKVPCKDQWIAKNGNCNIFNYIMSDGMENVCGLELSGYDEDLCC